MKKTLFAAFFSLFAPAAFANAPAVPPSPPAIGDFILGGTPGDCLYVATGSVIGQQSCGAFNLTIASTGVSGAAGLLFSDGSLLQSFAATYSSTNGPNLSFANNASFTFNADGTVSAPSLRFNTPSGDGYNLEEFWSSGTIGGYITSGGALFTTTGVVVSGTRAGNAIQWPNNQTGMMGCWQDVNGYCLALRDHYSEVGNITLVTQNANGAYAIGLEAANAQIDFGTSSTWNTWAARFGLGNQSALLQFGGADTVSPVAYTAAASSASAPVNLTATTSAAGQNQLSLNGSQYLTQAVQVGMTCTDTTHPTVIPSNTTITSIAWGAGPITLSANITGAGVTAGDTIQCSAPNVAGANLTIAGGRGTGNQPGGSLILGYAPAGSSGSSQNAWLAAATINGSGLTLGVQGTLQGALTLANTNSTYSATLKSSNSATAAVTYTLPVAPPVANGYMLTSTTAGVWSWVNPGAATLSIGSGVSGSTPSSPLCVDGSGNLADTGCATGLSFPATISGGTAGGVAYFSGATTLASSALLGNGLLMTGGGASGAPSTVTLGGDCTFISPNITCLKTSGTAFGSLATASVGTGVVTALGINAGAHGGIIIGTNNGTNVGIGTFNVFSAGSQNVLVGPGTMGTSGASNMTAVGGQALTSANSTAGADAAFGYEALTALTTANNVTGVGPFAFLHLTTGGNNAGLGYNVGTSIVGGTGNTLLGASADPGSDASNTIVIASGGSKKIDYGATTASAWTLAGQLYLSTTPTTSTGSSGAKYLCYYPTTGQVQLAASGTCS